MALHLVQQDLTEAAMLRPRGSCAMGGSASRETGAGPARQLSSPHQATLDVLERAQEQFVREPELGGEAPVVLMEMTLRHLRRARGLMSRIS